MSLLMGKVQPRAARRPQCQGTDEFLDAFDAFKRAWKSDERLYFKEVFDTLSWSWRGGAERVMELEAGEDGDLSRIDTALKPETVKELEAMARRLELEQCRTLFEKHVAGGGRFRSFDESMGYGGEWLALIQQAADGDEGLVVAVFG